MTTRSVLSTLMYAVFFTLYNTFYVNSKRVFTPAIASLMNLHCVAVMVMAIGTPLAISDGSEGYVNGLTLPLEVGYSLQELTLLQSRLTELLGVQVKITLSRRRTFAARNILVIPNSHLEHVRAVLEPYMLPEYMHLFNEAT